MSLLLCHTPLCSFLPGFPPPSIAPFLSSPSPHFSLTDRKPFLTRALQWAGWLYYPDFPDPCKQDWQQPTAWDYSTYTTYLRPTAGQRCPSSQPTLQSTVNLPILGYIRYPWKMACQVMAFAVQNIYQKTKVKLWIFSLLSHRRPYHSKASRASLYLIHALLGMYFCPELHIFKQYQGPNNNIGFESLKFSSMF